MSIGATENTVPTVWTKLKINYFVMNLCTGFDLSADEEKDEIWNGTEIA